MAICRRCGKIEKKEVFRALAEADGNVLKAAVALGVGIATLYRRIKEYGWTREGEEKAPPSKVDSGG